MSRVDSTFLKDIKNIHREFTLCGKPRNSLLTVSDDLLVYILCLLRNELPPVPKASIEQWISLTDILNHNRIIPFLYSRISILPEKLRPPKYITNIMREYFFISRVQNIKMDKQLERLLLALKQEQIKVLVMKGPAIAWSIYPDPAMRPYDDIDLLVLPQQFVKARKILGTLGYMCEAKLFEILKDVQSEEHFHYQDRSTINLQVELHWDLHCFYGAKHNIALDDLFHNAITVKTSSFYFETFNAVDTLLHMVAHIGFSHTKDIRLSWISDIAQISSHLKVPEDWILLQTRSIEWGIRLLFEKIIKMAEAWNGINVPDGFADFSSWPKPLQNELAIWPYITKKHESTISMLKIRLPGNLNLFEKMRLLFRLIFPPSDYILIEFPCRYKWQVPWSYIQYWLKWLTKIF
jgi:hypothetical protein